MTLEYMNGVRVTKLHHEKTPLEAAIDRYETMAKKHYSLNHKESTLTKEERKAELKISLAFLENERRQLETIAEIQARLAKLVDYREQGLAATKGSNSDRQKALAVLRNESHHPTDDLEAYMRAEGVPKPSHYHTAHHILPGKGRWQQVLVARARVHMHTRGIRINDPANGVYLVHLDDNTPHWSMPNSRGHLKYHTSNYEVFVSSRVRQIADIDALKTQLQIIGRILQTYEPKDAIHKISK